MKIRLLRLAIALDKALNWALGGSRHETISRRAARARDAGHPFGCVLCRILNWIDPGHCDYYLKSDKK